MRYKIVLAYDGTEFHGWAKQPNLPTVQSTLEEAMNRVLRLSPDHAIQLTVAGRTDVGVHALEQTVHFDVDPDTVERCISGFKLAPADGQEDFGDEAGTMTPPIDRFSAKLKIKLNSIFSVTGQIRIHNISAMPTDFDARFSAMWREYEYRIADDISKKDPRLRRHTYWHRGTLNVDVMNAAATALIGFNDFATFCKPRPGSTTIRTLHEFRWTRGGEDNAVTAYIRADAFCHNMVRALIGAVVAVGEGRLTESELLKLHSAQERTSRFKVFPPHGLTMLGVHYPDPAEYGVRDQATRGRRSL